MLSTYNTLGSVPSMSKKNKGQKRGTGTGQVALGRLRQNRHKLNAIQGYMGSPYLGKKVLKYHILRL